ncbi:preprotein translocase subunit YajC [Hymenobacter taeanensis]|uniref:Sec translocon accessory complex subunit YajC n=1 Tax=Hymenobacter taeanensis TaxID=2735321 RepID=A0A6M6BF71_9BACT|nr:MULTISPECIES: preprotein translocase subunit YajC [Hymenobacter]QJX46877.1 preprotein translocase subunit YajC [Hymenobacter taeanensis]UOQ80749.1 preprotein translocase subunit YajC [Hymenobacter sp. 5414T-23]
MFSTLLLQAGASSEGLTSLLFPIAIAVVVYFFMIRPQQKRSADAKKFRASIVKGSNVVTIGGLHGKVLEVNEESVIVEVDKGVRLKFDRTAIAREAASKSLGAATAPTTTT